MESNQFITPSNLKNQDLIKILENVKNEDEAFDKLTQSLPSLLDFLNASMNDEQYVQKHACLLKKIWTHVDAHYSEFNPNQQQAILNAIKQASRPKDVLPSNYEIIGTNQPPVLTNRLLMLSHGDYFVVLERLIKLRGKEGEEKPLKFDLTDLSPKAFSIVTHFLETGELLPIPAEGLLIEVYHKFHELELKEGMSKVAEKTEISPENLVYYFGFANQFGTDNNPLKTKILDEFKTFLISSSPENHEEIVELMQAAVANNYTELAQLCSRHLQDDLIKELENELKNEKKLPDQKLLQSIERTCKMLIYPETKFPKEVLEKLSFPALLTLLKLKPMEINSLNLSVYSFSEIAQLAPFLTLTITELDLSNKEISGATLSKIASRCPNLEKLNLSGAEKWNERNPRLSFKEDWKALSTFRKLTHLDVSLCQDAAPYLEKLLTNNIKQLQTVNMADCILVQFTKEEFDIDDEFGGRCLKILKDVPQLRSLNLNNVNIDREEFDQFLSTIHPSMEEFSIERKKGNATLHFDKMGRAFPYLRSLNLLGVSLSLQNLSFFSEMGKDPSKPDQPSSMEKLWISVGTNGDRMIEEITKHLPNVKILTS